MCVCVYTTDLYVVHSLPTALRATILRGAIVWWSPSLTPTSKSLWWPDCSVWTHCIHTAMVLVKRKGRWAVLVVKLNLALCSWAYVGEC